MNTKKTISVLSIIGYAITVGFIFGLLMYPKIEPVMVELQWRPIPGVYYSDSEQDEVAEEFKSYGIRYKFNRDGQLLIKGKESLIGLNNMIFKKIDTN